MYEYFRPTHRRVIMAFVAILLLIMLMVSCSRPAYSPAYYGSAPVQVAPMAGAPMVQAAPMAPAPVIVNNGGGGHGGSDGFFSGMLMGHLLSRPSTVVHHSVTTTAPAQRYNSTYNAAPRAPLFSGTSSRGISTISRPSFGGGSRISIGRRR